MSADQRNRDAEIELSRQLVLVEEEMIDECAIQTGATEEVEDLQLGPLTIFRDSGFDPVTEEHHHLMLHELYQPIELSDGRLSCKICHHSSTHRTPIFTTRAQFSTHRYKFHGSYLNLLPCPENDCHTKFPSLIALKKHLQIDHQLPIETHYKQFSNMSEFEIWRGIIEECTGSTFVLHNKQPQLKRNVMHCSRSEHKQIAAAKHRIRSNKMKRPGSACPAHISYLITATGTVDVVYQLYHCGHDRSDVKDRYRRERRSEDEFVSQLEEEELSSSIIFPLHNRLPRSTAMQYVQLSLLDMPDSLYNTSRYSQLLVVLCVQSSFIMAKAIHNPRTILDHQYKSTLVRQLIEMFTQFGCPVGFSVANSSSALYEAIEGIEHVFNVNMIHIGNISPDLSDFRKSILDKAQEELMSEERWPEVVPFAVYAHNTEGGNAKYATPYEMMFGRLHPHASTINEQLSEAEMIQQGLDTRFEVGDDVLVRHFDRDIVPCGPLIPSNEQQASNDYLNGIIGEVSWIQSPFYPYKVFICRSTEQPNTECPFVWVSPFDIAPSIDLLRQRRSIQRRKMLLSLLCKCRDDIEGSDRCDLPRSDLCQYKFSRTCCAKEGRRCDYHQEYMAGGDTYKRVEGLAKKYTDRRGYLKDEMNRNEGRTIGYNEEILSIEGDERLRREDEDEEGIQRDIEDDEDDDEATELFDDEVQPSSSKMIMVDKSESSEKSEVIRGNEVKEEDIDEGDMNNDTNVKKRRLDDNRIVMGNEKESRPDSSIDRRKSNRLTKPNILYRSFV